MAGDLTDEARAAAIEAYERAAEMAEEAEAGYEFAAGAVRRLREDYRAEAARLREDRP